MKKIREDDVIEAIKTIRDYCKMHQCDPNTCRIVNTCGHFLIEKIEPCKWEIVDAVGE